MTLMRFRTSGETALSSETRLLKSGQFAHCAAGSREVGSVVIAGTLPLSASFHWISPVVWGNICGGVFIVSLLNYGQAKEL
jgi:formate-nitrite transporter family protein